MNPSARQPLFLQGDLVCHRASGQLGVIISPMYACDKHDPFSMASTMLHMQGYTEDCEVRFSGSYRVSRDIDDECLVEEYLLEKVETNEEEVKVEN